MKQLLFLLALLGFGLAANAQTTFATADTMSIGVVKMGTVTGIVGQHYYKTALPANQGVLRLITSTSNTGAAFGIVQYRVFWKNQNTINYYNVNRNPVTSGADTFIVGALQADSLYLLVDNVWAGQTQNYTLKYDILSAAPNNETSPFNDTRQTAEVLPVNTVRSGYAGFSTMAGADGDDYYKIVFPRNGTFRMYVNATSMTAAGTNVLPRVYFYDRNGGASLSAFRNNNASGFTWSHLGNASFPMTAPFCSTCNRMRLTADGKLKNCLFSEGEADLLTPFRRGENILPLISANILSKEKELGGQFTNVLDTVSAAEIHNRSMITIGG